MPRRQPKPKYRQAPASPPLALVLCPACRTQSATVALTSTPGRESLYLTCMACNRGHLWGEKGVVRWLSRLDDRADVTFQNGWSPKHLRSMADFYANRQPRHRRLSTPQQRKIALPEDVLAVVPCPACNAPKARVKRTSKNADPILVMPHCCGGNLAGSVMVVTYLDRLNWQSDVRFQAGYGENLLHGWVEQYLA